MYKLIITIITLAALHLHADTTYVGTADRAAADCRAAIQQNLNAYAATLEAAMKLAMEAQDLDAAVALRDRLRNVKAVDLDALLAPPPAVSAPAQPTAARSPNPRTPPRDEALALIRQSRVLPSWDDYVPIGAGVKFRVLVNALSMHDRNQGTQMDVYYGALHRLKFLQIDVLNANVGTWTISVTPAGARNGREVDEEHYGYRRVYWFRLADRIPETVTGIRLIDDTTCAVNITYRFGNHSDIHTGPFKTKDTSLHVGTVIFRRYDDGWRPASFQALR